MTFNNFNYNHLMPLYFKGLNYGVKMCCLHNTISLGLGEQQMIHVFCAEFSDKARQQCQPADSDTATWCYCSSTAAHK